MPVVIYAIEPNDGKSFYGIPLSTIIFNEYILVCCSTFNETIFIFKFVNATLSFSTKEIFLAPLEIHSKPKDPMPASVSYTHLTLPTSDLL